jgi:hypothetical protein
VVLNGEILHGIGNQQLGELSGFALGDHPADHVPAEYVDDDVQVVVVPQLARGRCLVSHWHVGEPDVALRDRGGHDMAINNAKLVTVPILVAMETRIEAKLESARADQMRWVLLLSLSNLALSAGTTAFLNMLQRS